METFVNVFAVSFFFCFLKFQNCLSFQTNSHLFDFPSLHILTIFNFSAPQSAKDSEVPSTNLFKQQKQNSLQKTNCKKLLLLIKVIARFLKTLESQSLNFVTFLNDAAHYKIVQVHLEQYFPKIGPRAIFVPPKFCIY